MGKLNVGGTEIQVLLEELSAFDKVEAIALGGSRAGTHNESRYMKEIIVAEEDG